MPKRVVPDGSGKRVPVMSRVTLEMRSRLEVYAASSGRSLGQEVEYRLDRSFSEEVMRASVGGEMNYGAGLRIAHLLDSFDLSRDQPWHSNDESRKAAISYLVDCIPRLLRQPFTNVESTDPELMEDAALMDAILATPYRDKVDGDEV